MPSSIFTLAAKENCVQIRFPCEPSAKLFSHFSCGGGSSTRPPYILVHVRQWQIQAVHLYASLLNVHDRRCVLLLWVIRQECKTRFCAYLKWLPTHRVVQIPALVSLIFSWSVASCQRLCINRVPLKELWGTQTRGGGARGCALASAAPGGPIDGWRGGRQCHACSSAVHRREGGARPVPLAISIGLGGDFCGELRTIS